MAKPLRLMELTIGPETVIAGPGAISKMLNDYVHARNGSPMLLGLGLIEDGAYLVLVRVGDGPMVGMSVSEARGASEYCLATELMPPEMRRAVGKHLAELAHNLTDLADQAEALQPKRRH